MRSRNAGEQTAQITDERQSPGDEVELGARRTDRGAHPLPIRRDGIGHFAVLVRQGLDLCRQAPKLALDDRL
jgi:hypothetical protein